MAKRAKQRNVLEIIVGPALPVGPKTQYQILLNDDDEELDKIHGDGFVEGLLKRLCATVDSYYKERGL